jgi:hypothetical protein
MTHRIHGLDFPRGPGGGVLTWHERPLMAAQYAGMALGAAVDAAPAIVMQGGIVGELDFTLQTLELYRRLHPQARLVLSTWADADAAALQRAQALGVQVVLSDKPAFAGQQNINLQIVTAAAGVLAAQAAGATHVLKTRTDQRLCAPDLLAYLHTLQESFPLPAPGAQKARLLTASLNTFRYRMYGVTDMFLFGRTEDMVAYWTPPLDERRFDPDAVHFRNLREFAQWRVCEVYLCTEFLQRTGWTQRWTLEDYWRLMAERFCVVDATSIDLLWPKYATREMRWTNYSEAAHPFTEIGFRDWLLMHHGLHRLQRIPEEILG